MASSKHVPLKFDFANDTEVYRDVQINWLQHLPLICVLHVPFRRSNLPTIISTFHVSELWLLILFPPALLFHLMCCHHWAKFRQRILGSCFWTLYLIRCYCLYFSVMFCYNKLAPICSPVIVAFFRCSKTVMKAIERE